MRARPPLLNLSLCAFVVAGVGAAACNTDPPFFGEAIGQFRYSTTLLEQGCVAGSVDSGIVAITEITDGGFSFQGILSYSPGTETAWFTRDRISREGTFNGQVFVSTEEALRRFQVPHCEPEFIVEETLRIALLSESQSRALGGKCPEDAASLLEPGTVPVDPDAGIFPPSAQPEGFDALLTCGLLIEEIRPEAECARRPVCTVTYRVEGVRDE